MTILTISDKSMGLYELKEKLKIAQQRGFSFNQKNKLTNKMYSSLSNINIVFYLKFPIPKMHRQFFKMLSQDPDFIQTFGNNRNNPFHFSIRKWFLDNQSL